MKKIIITIASLSLFSSCGTSLEKERCFTVTNLVGDKKNIRANIPEKSTVFIHTDRGSYSLVWSENSGGFISDGTIRSGVIDFEEYTCR